MSKLHSWELAQRVREHVVEMTARGASSHVASALSCADLLAVLYSRFLRVDPSNAEWSERDRFVLSKGHAGAAVYATLAESGFFPTSWLTQHYADGSRMSGHVSHKGIPGVEVSTGSLGHGLPVATGMAFAAISAHEPWRVVCLMSDGECDEGTVWEAALFASHHALHNLVVVIDYNKIQSLGTVESTLGLEPFADKWRSFGWQVEEVDGHDHDGIDAALSAPSDRPKVVLAHTVKGKGVSFMEGTVLWHYRTPAGDELEAARAELATLRGGGRL